MKSRSVLDPIPETLNGHVWMLKEDGKVDKFALSYDHHNGPRCKNCDKGFCQHCNDLFDHEAISPCNNPQ